MAARTGTSKGKVCLGVIVGVKGLKGDVRIKSFTEHPADVAAYGPLTSADGRAITLDVVGGVGDVVIAKIAGVTDRTAAESLKGLELFIDRAVLPATEEGTFYHADLVGLAVELENGTAVGRVAALHNYGGGDVMEVAEEQGSRTALLPFTAAVVKLIDVAQGKVVIAAQPDLFGAAEDRDGEDQDAGHG